MAAIRACRTGRYFRMVPGLMAWAERHHGKLYLVVALSLVIATLLQIRGNECVTVAVLAIGVALLGLPHGALDTALAPRNLGRWRFYNQDIFYCLYALVAAMYGLLWWWWPTGTLVSFLVLSAWHFGTDWASIRSWSAMTGYGFAVVCLPACAQREEVKRIFLVLGSQETGVLLDSMAWLGPLGAAAGVLGAVKGGSWWSEKLAELITIVTSALILPPLLYFLAYFCFLHSPRHFFRTARQLGLLQGKELARTVGPAVAVTVAAGVLAWFLLPTGVSDGRVLTVIFVGLAALTLPHMLLAWISGRARKQEVVVPARTVPSK